MPRSEVRASELIKTWNKNPLTLEFLGTGNKSTIQILKWWKFDHFKMQAGLPSFVLSVSEWIEKTKCHWNNRKKRNMAERMQIKDPYMFEFLDLPGGHSEKDLEKAITLNLQKISILEIGKGYLLGNNIALTVGNKDYRTDLLFYHRDLHGLFCEPEMKILNLNLRETHFYLEALDRDVKRAHETQASANFSKELTTSVMWLINKGIDIKCVKLSPYKFKDDLLLDIVQIIPLPEAENYLIKIREKTAERQVCYINHRDKTKYIFNGIDARKKDALCLKLVKFYTEQNSAKNFEELL
ncbi:hypothetical protein FQR65_LT19171 [Abscondita terminalis]|nr:hypothetical protein FQR65_LT19171 [Abscondita terminalis]